jgi:hypothetical protein
MSPVWFRVQRQPDGPWPEVLGSGVGRGSHGLRRCGRRVSVAADHSGDGAVSWIHLRWRRQIWAGVRIQGDAWEHGYGYLQW